MQKYTYICWIHTDAMINRRTQDFFRKIFTSHFIARVRKGLLKGLHVRGSWRPNITEIFWPQSYGRQRCVFLVLWCSTGGPGPTLLDDGFLYCILSVSSPDPNSSGPQAPSVWCGFPYHISSPTVCNSTAWLLCWLSYIIVQRPLDRPRDLWNRMFNRHQAEITVMQFRGASVYESIMGFFFTSSHFISQFLPTRFPLITVIRMCHFLPVHHLEWHFWPGQKVKT